MVYLGLTYTIVYVGGVMVLLLFVIMMMNLGLQSPSRFTQNLPLSIVVICIYTQIILNIDDIIRPSSVIDIFQSITSVLTVSDINQHNSMYNDLQISFSNTMSSISEATQIQSIGFELYTHQGI
jgi:NADH:ubiquinone oxidoreductase subunit 6 (subunit J)